MGMMRPVEMPLASKYQRLNRGAFSKIDYVKPDGTLVALEWLYCREYFQDESAGIRRFLFCHKPNKCRRIAAFIHKLEEILNLEERTEVGPTQRHNISWLRVSPWWTCSSMKRSLFTILVRCGQNYNIKEDNLDEALFSVMYTKQTERAVRRFMGGFTRYTGKKKGWYSQFKEENCMDSVLERLLVCPSSCSTRTTSDILISG